MIILHTESNNIIIKPEHKQLEFKFKPFSNFDMLTTYHKHDKAMI